ncbi:MAG: hypothetical protein WCG82_08765 [Bacteroidota bacterium]
MTFSSIDDIKKAGFKGFLKMSELFSDSSSIPKIKGVYLVLYLTDKSPEFKTVGTGGHFKGKDPNVSIAELKKNWVDGTIVVYIGKAGKEGSSATLHSRLKQYFGFGKGGNIGHWGGRLIWQLRNSSDLVVCWKELPTDDPRTVEADLLKKFIAKYATRPFANLSD